MSRKKKVSIKDVAAVCGVSTATVSRYLSNPESCSPATGEKVRNGLNMLGYRISDGAKLPGRKVIGILTTDPTEQWPSMLTCALERRFRQNGYFPVVCHSQRTDQNEKLICQYFIEQHVSGVVYVSGGTDIEPMLSAVGIPTVYIDPIRDKTTNTPICVCSNHYLGAYMATEHLISLGCRRILFLGRYAGAGVNLDRERGYMDALKAHGIEAVPELIQDFSLQLEPDGPSTRDLVVYLIKYGLSFDGIFATNDVRAYGALSALHMCGLRTPEDIKLVGFDNLPISTYSTPPISTIRQDIELIAASASDILLDLIENGDHYTEREFILPVSLVRRGST